MAANGDPINDADSAERKFRRQRMLEFLNSDELVWRDEDHPDIVAIGTAEWVRKGRNEPSVRLEGRDENLDLLDDAQA